MKLYLDACCLNRPFDDQRQIRVHLESEAILSILERIRRDGAWHWVGSEVLEFEIKRMRDLQRKVRVRELLVWVDECIASDEAQIRAAKLEALGFGPLDAFHLACAETARADVFLTTDDQLQRLASRVASQVRVQVDNPLAWLTKQVQAEQITPDDS